MDVTHMEDTKTCHTCGQIKTLDSFYPYKRNKDGHLGVCKRCFLAKQQVYKQRTRASHRWLWMKHGLRWMS